MRVLSLGMVVVLMAGGMGFAQEAAKTSTPDAAKTESGGVAALVDEAKTAYGRQKTNLIAAAEAMPAESYAFKATPEVRSYGELLTHIAMAQKAACGIVSGEAAQGRPAPSTAKSKAEVMAELKTSFDACDAANGTLTAANALDVVGSGYLHGTRVGIVQKNVAHDNEMYGAIAVYLRLKGIVPPTSAKKM